jgi:hypothetical protein
VTVLVAPRNADETAGSGPCLDDDHLCLYTDVDAGEGVEGDSEQQDRRRLIAVALVLGVVAGGVPLAAAAAAWPAGRRHSALRRGAWLAQVARKLWRGVRPPLQHPGGAGTTAASWRQRRRLMTLLGCSLSGVCLASSLSLLRRTATRWPHGVVALWGCVASLVLEIRGDDDDDDDGDDDAAPVPQPQQLLLRRQRCGSGGGGFSCRRGTWCCWLCEVVALAAFLRAQPSRLGPAAAAAAAQ